MEQNHDKRKEQQPWATVPPCFPPETKDWSVKEREESHLFLMYLSDTGTKLAIHPWSGLTPLSFLTCPALSSLPISYINLNPFKWERTKPFIIHSTANCYLPARDGARRWGYHSEKFWVPGFSKLVKGLNSKAWLISTFIKTHLH